MMDATIIYSRVCNEVMCVHILFDDLWEGQIEASVEG